MKKICFFLILCSFFSCTIPRHLEYRIDTIYDAINDYTITSMYGNSIASDDRGVFEFNISKYRGKEPNIIYTIDIFLTLMNEWVFINSGKSLLLLVDDEKIEFIGKGSLNNRNRIDRGYLYFNETARYNVTREQMEKIINAKKVNVILVGEKKTIDGSLTKVNKSRIKDFLN